MTLLYYLFNLLLLSGVVWLIWLQAEINLRPFFIPALVLKLACGILLGLLYQHYFIGSDTFGFHNSAINLSEYFKIAPTSYLRLLFTGYSDNAVLRATIPFPSYSNSYFLVLVLSVLNILTDGSYYLNGLYFSLFSFSGCWRLTRVLSVLKPETKLAAIISFLFFPSVVFWSSGIIKEAIYVGAVCWFIAFILQIIYRPTTSLKFNITGLVISGFLLWKIRYYFAALVYPLFGSFLFIAWLNQQQRWEFKLSIRLILFGFAFLALCLIVSQMHGLFRLDYFLHHLMENYTTLVQRSTGSPVIYYPNLQPTVKSVLGYAPQAAWQAVFRPYIWEGDTLFYILAGLENLVLLAVALLAVGNSFVRKPIKFDLFTTVLLIYCLVLAAMIGLTTPNLGSLNRYRVAFLPFLAYIFMQGLPLNKYFSRITKKLAPDKSRFSLRR